MHRVFQRAPNCGDTYVNDGTEHHFKMLADDVTLMSNVLNDTDYPQDHSQPAQTQSSDVDFENGPLTLVPH